MIRLILILPVLLPFWLRANPKADDTLYVTIRQADELFLKQNYTLLAGALNVDISKAAEMQARLYPNPVFTADLNAYDPANNQAFHIGPSGQKVFQVDQLILLGGKRKAALDIAKTETAMAELEFQDLVLQLRFQLRTSFYRLDQQQNLIQKYNAQLNRLKSLIDAYDIQAAKGNMPLKDVIRLKGVYMNLSGEKSDCIRQYAEQQIQLQLLLGTDLIVKPVVGKEDLTHRIKILDEQDLVNQALTYRPEYLLMQQALNRSEKMVSLEKRTAIPDINLFTSYDQRGGAFNNQVNAGFSIPLPLWNRNQGAVKIAQLESQQLKYDMEQARLNVKAEVNGYLALYNRAVHDFERSAELYNEDFELTLNAMSENFTRGNIGLLEFVDFFEAYNEAISDLSKVSVQLEITAEQLNYITGKELF